MPARKKPKRKTRKSAPRKRRAPAPKGPLLMRVAEQMAGVVERGLKRTLAKLPRRGATAATKAKLADAVAALKRQADSFREQAQAFEARGAEGPAAVWRALSERLERAVGELRRRLSPQD